MIWQTDFKEKYGYEPRAAVPTYGTPERWDDILDGSVLFQTILRRHRDVGGGEKFVDALRNIERRMKHMQDEYDQIEEDSRDWLAEVGHPAPTDEEWANMERELNERGGWIT